MHIYWSGRADLNRRPPVPKTGALPLRYAPKQLNLSEESIVSKMTYSHNQGRLKTNRFDFVKLSSHVLRDTKLKGIAVWKEHQNHSFRIRYI